LAIFPPCQHVLEQTAVRIRPSGDVVIQMTLNLPARGRTILGQAAVQTIETLASLVENTMQYWNTSLKSDKIEKYVDSIEDQVWLQSQLDSQGLAAFVRNGAILPRLSGADDRPMDSETAIPFQSPPTLHTSFKLPNSGITIHGMGLRKGISIVVGGGFHGKSTLLEALQVGVYPKVPGDGREFVVTSPTAMKIRAEDGRPITAVDISPFIGNLPFGRDTSCFSTPDASGSTSQAANIVEVS
jgi:predicted ABC-class ATPase